MAGLVGYASSDEDEEETQEPQSQASETPAGSRNVTSTSLPATGESRGTRCLDEKKTDSVWPAAPEETQSTSIRAEGETAWENPSAHANGLIGPSRPPPAAAYPEHNTDDTLEDEEVEAAGNGKRSDKATATGLSLPPYSVDRSALRELTMPKAPDFDIPQSPDGREPPPALKAVNKRLAEFLDLKSKKGIHFNARMSQSSAIRNPAFMDKLLVYAGLDDDDSGMDGHSNNKIMASSSSGDGSRFRKQYENTLPIDVWDPDRFPAWAYRTRLKKVHEETARKRAREHGERPNFVPASAASKVSKH